MFGLKDMLPFHRASSDSNSKKRSRRDKAKNGDSTTSSSRSKNRSIHHYSQHNRSCSGGSDCGVDAHDVKSIALALISEENTDGSGYEYFNNSVVEEGGDPLNDSANTESTATSCSEVSINWFHNENDHENGNILNEPNGDNRIAAKANANANALYKPRFYYSPLDLLDKATLPTTPRTEVLDALASVKQSWSVIEATTEGTHEEIVEPYREHFQARSVPELLKYVETNVPDHECVFEAIRILSWLRSLLAVGQSPTKQYGNKERENTYRDINLVFLEAHAVAILVPILSSHKTTDGFLHSTHKHVCLFPAIWNLLMEVVLSPQAIAYFRDASHSTGLLNIGIFEPTTTKKNHHARRKQKRKQHREKDQMRRKLVAAVDLGLDRDEYAMSSLWMAQALRLLTMLLRTSDDTQTRWAALVSPSTETATTTTAATTGLEPNDDVRSAIWERKITSKFQTLLESDSTRKNSGGEKDHCSSQYPWFKYEEVSAGAISFFWCCLFDRTDALSDSLDREALSRFVHVTMNEFPNSKILQSEGIQILSPPGEASTHHHKSSANKSDNSSNHHCYCSEPSPQYPLSSSFVCPVPFALGNGTRTILVGDPTRARCLYDDPLASLSTSYHNLSNGSKSNRQHTAPSHHPKRLLRKLLNTTWASCFADLCAFSDEQHENDCDVDGDDGILH